MRDDARLAAAAARLREARFAGALTGAGISVISDAVNVASRLETLTREKGEGIIASGGELWAVGSGVGGAS